jgi:YHS domain-containing protein
MKRLLILSVIAVLASAQIHAQKSAVFSSSSKAIRGYDPVAYFTENKAVKGSSELVYNWMNANWYFSTQQNLDMFKADPDKFAPQYGGYCAYGCSEGHKAPTDPEAFTIVNGKLYLNYNLNVRKIWRQDTDKKIELADMQWPTIKEKE